MPNVKWKYGVLWTLILQGLSGVRAGPGESYFALNYPEPTQDQSETNPANFRISDGPLKRDLLDLFNIKKLPYETGIKAAKSNYCSKVSPRRSLA